MNLERHPDIARFLNQLGDPNQQNLFCPVCGSALDIDRSPVNHVAALCPSCDFHASVPHQRKE